jgi:ribosome modulation factor
MVKAAANAELQNVDLTDVGGPGYEPSPWDIFDTQEQQSEGTSEVMEEVTARDAGELRVVPGDPAEAEETVEISVEIDGEMHKVGDAESVNVETAVHGDASSNNVEGFTQAAEADEEHDSDCDCDDGSEGDDYDDDSSEEADVEVEAETTYMRKLREAEQDYAEACLELAGLEDKLADTKEEIKDQREVCKALAGKLRTIKKQGEVQLDIDDVPLLEKKRKKRHDGSATDGNGIEADNATAGGGVTRSGEPVGHAARGSKSGDSNEATGGRVSSNEWRKVPIEELEINHIKGMGAKKYDSILEVCRTLGELEDLRAGAGLTSIKGIGRGMADQIEDVVLAWLSRNRDAEVLAAAASGAIEARDHSEQVASRAAQIRDDTSFEHKDIFQGAFDSGKQAYEDPESDVTDCPWTQGEQQDAWIAGWLNAESLDECEESDPRDMLGEPETTSSD